jgi:uncharacterized damage-inducible protein DinB
VITAAYAQTMAAYNAEMNRRLYEAASRLSDAERRQQRGAFWGSIHGTLNHVLWADRMWMSRFAGWPRPEGPLAQSGELIDDFEALSMARVQADADILRWTETLSQTWLDGDTVWFSGAMQQHICKPSGLVLVHFFNHQIHHRGQVHCLLTMFGQATGSTDLPFVLSA